MKTALFYAVTLAGALWLEILQQHVLGGSWISLEGLTIATIYWGLSRGATAGAVTGFTWGLFMDASTLSLLGERALWYTVAGFLAGRLRRQLDESKPWTQAIFTLLVSIGVLVGEMVTERIFHGNVRPLYLGTWLQPVWNALAAPLLFAGLRAWDQFWNVRVVRD